MFSRVFSRDSVSVDRRGTKLASDAPSVGNVDLLLVVLDFVGLELPFGVGFSGVIVLPAGWGECYFANRSMAVD